MGDLIFENLGKIIAGIILLMLVLTYSDVEERKAHHKKFMAECLRDHKQYECDVLWARANPKDSSADDMAIGMAIGMSAGMAGRR